jgi:hypothetical protein
VLYGQLELDSFSLEGLGEKKLKGKTILAEESLTVKL